MFFFGCYLGAGSQGSPSGVWWWLMDGRSLKSSTPPKEPVERSSLQFRVLALKRSLPCIWRVLPVVGSSRNSDMGQGCANTYVRSVFFF